MDGRSVVMANDATEFDVKEQLHSAHERAATYGNGDSEGEDSDDGGDDSDMVLSKDDFLMLQAFHRFVPLPALSSRIVRLLCEEDLQVADEDEGERLPESSTSAWRGAMGEDTAIAPPAQLVSGLKAVKTLSRTSVATQSPLARRSSTKISSQTMLKPHRQVDLAAQTPRIKRISTSIDADERTG